MKKSSQEAIDSSHVSTDVLILLKEEIYSHPMVPVGPDNFASLGDDDASRRQAAFLGNRRLCFKVARDYRFCGEEVGIPFTELVQEAQITLWKASLGYDPEKGKFSDYSGRAMRSRLHRLVIEGRKKVAISYDTLDTYDEESHGVLDERYDNPDSINPLQVVLKNETEVALDEALDRLPPKGEQAVRMYSGFGYDADATHKKWCNYEMTYERIGNRMGYTRQRIEQIINGNLPKLRQDPDLNRALCR